LYCLNRTKVDKAGFATFMKSIRENWLEAQEVKLLILASTQGDKPIVDWIMLVESTNAGGVPDSVRKPRLCGKQATTMG